MIEIFWLIMEKLGLLIMPLLALYVLFDLMGALLFNKR